MTKVSIQYFQLLAVDLYVIIIYYNYADDERYFTHHGLFFCLFIYNIFNNANSINLNEFVNLNMMRNYRFTCDIIRVVNLVFDVSNLI